MKMDEKIKVFEEQLTIFVNQRDILIQVIEDLTHLIRLCKEYVALATGEEEINP